MRVQDSAVRTQRRLQRHLSHTRATYAHFIKHLCAVGELKPALAEAAAISVISALERRIQPGQARHLEAQLPRRLVAFLPPHRDLTHVRRFGREAFLQTVADDLHMDVGEVEPIVRAVIAGLRDRISEGQADDVANNLPEDLRALWRLSQ
ncbi:MAG TPA: DUF2267 domain-containing protein [Aggregicoccus sp.]|nr:DUF2267 domain-containing protein [Aggregicoccus sp.]